MTFARQIATAKKLIKRNGALVTWRQIAPGVGENPAKPAVGTPTNYPVFMAFFPTGELSLRSTLSMLLGTEIPSGRLYGLMGAVPFTPGMKDTVLGTPFGDLGIIDKNGIDEFNPNGESIFFTVRFAR